MAFGREGFRGRGSASSPLKVLFDWLDRSGDSTAAGTEVWVYVLDCGCRPEERAMIWSCLAADGERSKCVVVDKALAMDSGLCWDWLELSIVWVNGQLFSPPRGRLGGEAGPSGLLT